MPVYETQLMDEYFAGASGIFLSFFDGFTRNLWPDQLLHNYVYWLTNHL